MSASQPQPNPLVVFDALNAYQKTMALKGAIELELFTHIGDGATTVAELSKRCDSAERGVRILCDFLAIHGLLTKADGTYGLTPESRVYLSKRSPTYIGSIAGFLAHDRHTAHFKDVAAAVRKGGSVDLGNMAPDDTVWVEFARSMAPMMDIISRRLAPVIAEPERPMKVLDIAAGHGLFGIAVATYNRAAEIVAVDWDNVLDVARENAALAGVTNRYRTIPGSAFDVDFGTAYDLVLLPAFLHHFDPPTNVRLLEKIKKAIKPTGLVATLETMPNDDRVTPPSAAAFSMMMLCTTPSGDAYTFRELDHMFRQAGFGESRVHNLGELRQVVLTKA
jgi:2-polyprenyl-3-methyl-5-hydroxy-6-metoxy-1,4-benzoquinol methylase